MATTFSNWRCDPKTLEPGLNEITFLDTRPNVFFIINNNPTYLYAGLESIPNNIKYEHLIKPNDTDIMGRPLPLSRIYIYNPKNISLTVKIFSDYTHFDIGLLKTIYARMDDEQLEKIKYDGIITGWQTPDVVNTFVTNYDDIVNPLIENNDNNTGIIYTLIDGLKNTIAEKIADAITNNETLIQNLQNRILGTYPLLSSINHSIISKTDYSIYLISGLNKMNTSIGILTEILNKQCSCNNGGGTEPDNPEPKPINVAKNVTLNKYNDLKLICEIDDFNSLVDVDFSEQLESNCHSSYIYAVNNDNVNLSIVDDWTMDNIDWLEPGYLAIYALSTDYNSNYAGVSSKSADINLNLNYLPADTKSDKYSFELKQFEKNTAISTTFINFDNALNVINVQAMTSSLRKHIYGEIISNNNDPYKIKTINIQNSSLTDDTIRFIYHNKIGG